MKKFISFLLAAVLLVSAVPTALATNDYSYGTKVVYQAAGNEAYIITVPAKLAPGGSGTVTLEGIWASNTLVTVTAQENVVLTNSINAVDQKTLDVTFAGISELGSNTESQKFTESVSVANIDNAIFGTWNGHFYYTVGTQELDTLELLQEKYEFKYYDTLNGAVNDVNDDTIGANANANKEDAVAGIYTNAGQTHVVLLKDTATSSRVEPSVNMTINLGGHKLTCEDVVAIKISSGDVIIDGRLDGSAVQVSNDNGQTIRTIQSTSSGVTTINGGTYTVDATGATSGGIICIYQNGGTLNISNAIISATSDSTKGTVGVYSLKDKMTMDGCEITSTSSGDGYSHGIVSADTPANITIKDCNIKATSTTNSCLGALVFGTATITNCEIRAYANYIYGNDSYISWSQGVSNNGGTLTLNDCYVIGTHTGVQNNGVIYINGGTYEGFGHGGFYFSGIGSTAYVRNATIRECAMPDGYIQTATSNGSAFYIGGSDGQNNIKVYMDNCNMYSRGYQITLRGSEGEQNNTLYISNSKLYDTNGDDIKIRIDNNTHKLYIGAGCTFTADNAFRSSDGTSMSSAVITTNETYIYNG